MSLPVTIEGQKYFVSGPSLADFRNFREFLVREIRRNMGESIPSGLSDDELERRYALIDKACAKVNEFERPWLEKLLSTRDGQSLWLFAYLRHDSPGMTLTFVSDLLARCEQAVPAALEGLREVRLAINSIIESKKNELEAKLKAQKEAAASAGTPTMTASTSV